MSPILTIDVGSEPPAALYREHRPLNRVKNLQRKLNREARSPTPTTKQVIAKAKAASEGDAA